MLSHRTTRTGLLAALIAALASAGTAGAGDAASGAKPLAAKPIVFPLLGKVRYFDDFGDSRPNGGHEGNDIVGEWRAPVVAAEAGRIQYHTTSSRAGCMLYLFGESGTTYLYIHLNNDLTRRRDNRGRCVQGTAYALEDGAKVEAGEQIAYNGDSGDAEGTYHLHFEVHPGGGAAVSPFSTLNA
ncbi:MAG TPA: M23 family metallopeptidase, partial [Gaiellaceae bacterium]